MDTDKGPSARVQQRRRTEARILAEARKTFAEMGYERTTIRAVAAAAHVDPGLVMHYFGSKETLFARVVEAPEEEKRAAPASLDEVVERTLADLVSTVEHEQDNTLAMLRSMLTQPEVAKIVRAEVAGKCAPLADLMTGEDAELRANLIGLTLMSVVIGRHLLQLDGLQDVPADAFGRVLRPGIEALTYGVPESSETPESPEGDDRSADTDPTP
jgi:AcrR family transcriptional regulator